MKSVSSLPRKQRIRAAKIPLHMRKRNVAAHLSKPLRSELQKRSIVLRKGDKVHVLRGSYKGKEGKIAVIDTFNGRIEVEGVTFKKASGTEITAKINTTNLVVLDIDRSDPRRFKHMKTKVKIVKKEKPVEKKDKKEEKKETKEEKKTDETKDKPVKKTAPKREKLQTKNLSGKERQQTLR